MTAFDKIKKWMFGEEATARKRAERHQPKVSIGLATAETGDRQDDVDGLESGGVIWPVEAGTHGGVSFLTSQSFYAFYDKKKKQVWLLDNESGKRHPGALPLVVGDTVFPAADTGGRGLVVRTALYGNDGLKRNVFIPTDAPRLEAHHEQPDPPINSSQIYDEDGRHGGLHYLTKVKLMVTKLCLGATDKLTEVFAPMFNFTRNGDGTPAHGLANFRDSSAMLSHEVDGPLAPADDGQHIGGTTSDGKRIHSGGIDRTRALYGDSASGILFSPKEFIREPWQSGSKDAFVGRVEEREDFNATHTNLCGKKARGMKKWQEWKPKASPPEVPPTAPPPSQPPPPIDGPPRDPTFPPPRNVFPKPDPVPLKQRLVPPVTSQPTNTGPNEEEQPSLRGIARPDFDPPTGTGFEEARSHGVGTEDEVWRRATGMTPREFFDLRRVSHDVAQGVAAATLPAGVSNVLMKAYLQSTFVQDSKGQWYGRRGNAIGFQTLMPGGLEGHMAYKARHGALLTETKQLTRLLLNYKNAAGFEARTYLALGARLSTGDEVVSGAEFYLDYSDDSDEPHLGIRFRDENGVITTAPKLKINGTTLSGLTGNEVTAASTLAADSRVPVATGNTRAVAASDFSMTRDGTKTLNTHDGSAMTITPAATFSSTLASGAHTITQAATASITAASTPMLDLNSALSGSNVRKRVFPVRASVTAGTTLVSWAIANGDGYMFRFVGQRKRTDSGGQINYVDYKFHVQNIGGTLTIQSSFDDTDVGGLAASPMAGNSTKGGTPFLLTFAPTAGTEVWNGHVEVLGPLNT